MIEELQNLLDRMLTPELSALIVEGYKTITEIGYTGYETDLNNFIHTIDDRPHEEVIFAVIAALNEGMDIILSEHEITFVFEDDDLEMKIQACKALMAVSSVYEYWRILAFTEDETISPEEAMAGILGELTTYTEEDWFPKVVSVTPALILSISDLMQDLERLSRWNEEPEEEAEDEGRARARARAKAYRGTLEGVSLLAMEQIVDGVKPGRPVGTFLDPNADTLQDMEDMTHVQLAQNLLFIVLLSDVPDERVLETAQQLCEELYEVGKTQAIVHDALMTEYQKVPANDDA